MTNQKVNPQEGAPAILSPQALDQLAQIVIDRLMAQNEGTCFTRRGSEVQVLYRPPYCTVDRTPTFSSDIPLGVSGIV